MENKFIIFVVFSTLAQNSAASSSTLYGLLSKNQTDNYLKIKATEDTAYSTKSQIYLPIADLVKQLAYNSTHGLELDTNIIPAALAATLPKGVEYVDTFFKTLEIIVGKNCPTVDEDALNSSIKGIIKQFTDSIILAVSGNEYTKKDSEIEKNRAVTQKLMSLMVNDSYNSMQTCLKSAGADSKNIIRVSKDASLEFNAQIIDSIYDAIRLFSEDSITGNNSKNLLNRIDDCWRRTKTAVLCSVETLWTVFEALYLQSYTKLGLDGGGSELYAIQYAWSVSSNRFRAAVRSIFDRIRAYLFHLKTGDTTVVSEEQIREKKGETFVNFKEAVYVLVNSISVSDSGLSDVIENAKKSFDSFLDRATEAYSEAIAKTQTSASYSEAQKAVESSKVIIISAAPHYLQTITDLITAGKNKGDVDKKAAAFRNEQLKVVLYFMNAIIDAIFTLAKASSTNGSPTADDFSAVDDFEQKAFSCVEPFTLAIAKLCFDTRNANGSN